ncbi:MAG: segregation/condensation protein A [Deltaproteobacteria bacterium CG11_big_fil_rev_8_21_14_0_20_47_16]|nr:MAG: segregation/condensation protein A [Deltaproteobacteria bacterium CG11_big_fil_rev_8_21_14_0_20_47_16]
MSETTNPIPESFAESSAYRINLDQFEGPLDLLLYLIKQNDIDIVNIPIAFITEQYLKYIDDMETIDVDVAGEFIVMAAELMQIKSQMLLPQAPALEEDEPDPRADLVRRLLEYQRYKEAANTLLARDQLERDVYVPLSPERVPKDVEGPIDGNVFYLVNAFNKILKKVPTDRYHEVRVDRISVNTRILSIVEELKTKKMMTLEQMIPENPTKFDVVVTFLALLEMGRLRMIQIHQAGNTEAIYVTPVMETLEGGDNGQPGDTGDISGNDDSYSYKSE